MSKLHRLEARVFGTPLMIAPAKLDTILGVLRPKLQGSKLDSWWDDDEPGEPQAPYAVLDGVAVLEVQGTLVRRASGMEAMSGLTSYERLSMALDQAIADPAARAIMLRVDSHGGEAAGVFDLADKIRAARTAKPIWASVDTVGYSAGYAIACAASQIWAGRTSEMGSIGVICVHVDRSGADEQLGLAFTAIYAGTHKNDFTPHAALSADARAVLQAEVERTYGLFADLVAKGRPALSTEQVKAQEAGLFFGADQAMAAGLADRSGTFDDALAALAASVDAARAPGPARGANLTANNGARQMTKKPDATSADPAAGAEAPEQKADNNVIDLQKVRDDTRSELSKELQAHVKDVTELCTLAGTPARVAEFLGANTPIGEVRETLMKERAARSGEHISTAHGPTPMAGGHVDHSVSWDRAMTSVGAVRKQG